MTSRQKRGVRDVRDGERHIYPLLDACNTTQDPDPKTSNPGLRRPPSRPTVLTNTRLRNTACYRTEKRALKEKNTDEKTSDGGQSKSHGKANAALPESVDIYSTPEIHSTLRVATALARTREQQPDLSLLVKNKLYSPNTAARFKKQPARKVTVPKSRATFQELMSPDVSVGALDTQFQDALNLRAAAVRPIQRPRDPKPQQSDILDPEEYVSWASVTSTSHPHPPLTCIRPQSMRRDDVHGLSKLVMNSF